MLRPSRFLATLAVLLAVGLAGCDSSDPTPDAIAPVFVLNQGQFGTDASGGITTYDPDTGEAGALTAPGGLVQRGVVRDGRLYLLLNFSDSFTTGRGRIDVIDVETGETLEQVDVGTPRDIAFVGDVAFVTDLYGNAVTPIFFSDNGTFVNTPIPVGDNPEGIVAHNGMLYVANSGFGFGSTLSVIDATSREVTETIALTSSSTVIPTCEGPKELAVGVRDFLFIVCTGRRDFSTGEIDVPGRLFQVELGTSRVFPNVSYTNQLLGGSALGQAATYDEETGMMYVLGEDAPGAFALIRVDTSEDTTREYDDVDGSGIAGIGTWNNEIYIGRLNAANPFSDDGTVTIHDLDGAETGRFTAGVGPAAFAFAEDE